MQVSIYVLQDLLASACIVICVCDLYMYEAWILSFAYMLKSEK